MANAEQLGEFIYSDSGSTEPMFNNIRLPATELPKFSGDVIEY